jgi:hypothetical protein
VEERSGDSEDTGFLPPEPAGPEPELGDRPAQPPPQAPPPAYGYAAPPPPPGYGYPPPPPTPAPAPGQHYQPPPGYGQPPAYGPPPGYAYPPPWGYPQQQVPDNGQAIAGFVLSIVSLGLLIVSAGLSTIISIGCAIAGIICSRNGKRKVDAGETPKHRGLAQAGFIIGWVGLGLSILATIFWIVVIVIAATSDDPNNDPFETATAVARVIGL